MAGMASGQSLVAKPRSAWACSFSQRIWMNRSNSFPFGRVVDATIHQDAKLGR